MKYQIKLTERTMFLNERNNPVDGYRITFTLDNGEVDWVEIPKAQFNPEYVNAEIAAVVKAHEALMPK